MIRVIAFLLAMVVAGTAVAAPISQKLIDNGSDVVNGGVIVPVPTAGYSQATIYGTISNVTTLTNFYLTCSHAPTTGAATFFPIPICDESTLFPIMDCRPRVFRWRRNVDGNNYQFTLPINYAAIRCVASGDVVAAEAFSAKIRLSNQ